MTTRTKLPYVQELSEVFRRMRMGTWNDERQLTGIRDAAMLETKLADVEPTTLSRLDRDLAYYQYMVNALKGTPYQHYLEYYEEAVIICTRARLTWQD